MASLERWQPNPKPRYVSNAELNYWKVEACKEYPCLHFDDAFLQWSYENERRRNVWWYNKAGQRCIILDDLDCRFDKSYSKKYRYLEENIAEGRTYLSYLETPTFEQTDKPKAELLKYKIQTKRRLVDPRYLLKLPNEIKDIILGYVLSLPKDLMIRPHPITTNWKRVWNIHPNFTIDGTRHYQYTRSMHKKQNDKEGEYLEYRRIILPAIDSSCLRVHSTLREYGARILYSSNTFAFSMVNRHLEHCPPYLLNKIYRPSHQKPNINCPSILSAMGHIQDGHRFIGEDRLQIMFDHLHGWAYFDPFLRFLYTIQPRNAASIKTLSFDGIVQRHNQCSSNSCQKRGVYLLDDLVMSLRLYILFIRKFCVNLEKLIIVAYDDHRVSTCRQHDHEDESLPESMKEALLPLLENEVRSIRSLRKLEVIINEEKGEEADDYDFAQETMDWFKDRTANRDARKREFNARRATAKPVQEKALFLKEQLDYLEEKLESVAGQEKSELLQEKSKVVAELFRNCEHCGEEHLSLECYNLCNYCGDAAHWRDTCQKLAVAELESDLERLMNYKEEETSVDEYGWGLESGGELDSGYQAISGEDSIEEGKEGESKEQSTGSGGNK